MIAPSSLSGRLILALVLGAVSPVAALAKTAFQEPRRTLGERPVERTVARGAARISAETGVPRSLYNVNAPVSGESPEAMARQFLRENAARLRLVDPLLADLALRATRNGLAGTTVRFEQRVRGIPVLASDLAVTIDRANRVSYVVSGYQPGLSLASAVPIVGGPDARAAAVSWLAVQGPLAHEASRLVAVPDGKAARLAWQVLIVPAITPSGDWEVLVDAETGEVFRALDRAVYVDGNGLVFDPDPLSVAHVTYGSPGYTDGGDATTAELDAARSGRVLPGLTEMGDGTVKLQGPYAEIVDSEAPFKGLFTQAGTSFDYNRSQDAFEAVHTYFHVDHVMRYLNGTLGVPVMPYQYTGGVRFDPSGLNGADNSHYITSTGQIAFGEGGVDDAEDADVVIHELGHGLHDWLTFGGLSQVEGLSEGFGDYVAQSYSRSLGQWNVGESQYHWVFHWDGHNEFWGGRTTNYSAPYPGGLVGQVHTDGQIWSSCLMRIWDDVGREKTDTAVFEGIAMTNSGASQNDAAQAVLQAAVALGYTPAEIQSFATHFQDTGYDVSVGVDYVSDVISDACESDATRENGVIEPGEIADVMVTVRSAALFHTGVTGVLSTTTQGITIVNDSATWPDLAPGVPAASEGPHFRVAVNARVACLTAIDFQLVLTTNEGGPYEMAFSRVVGQTPTPGGLPVAIPDNAPTGVTSTLSIESALPLDDVKVRVKIQHTWVGDLILKLRSPAGTEVTLLDRPGVPGSSFGCGDDDMDVVFDDGATLVPETHCPGTTPWLGGAARPVDGLSAFQGQSALGNWVLTASDRAAQDVGTLVSWEILTSPPLPALCSPCQSVAGIGDRERGDEGGALGANRPNPFARRTEISFRLGRGGHATLRVHDVAGKVVATLLDRVLGAGPHAVAWDGRDAGGRTVPAGVYFYRLTTAEGIGARRMLLIR